MQFQRRHRDRTRVHPLANGNVDSSVVGTIDRVFIVAFDDEQSYRLEMTRDEAAKLARRLLTIVDFPQEG